jgi:hypothetical protein
MLALKIPKISLIILIFSFCLHLTGPTVADECWDREGSGPTVTGNYTYPPFQYDPDNPDEIDRNNSIPICVIGGIPPYTWQVNGNGFSLSEGATEGLTNTLIAESTACGAATITVTDKFGASCTGYVRCTTGNWSDFVQVAITVKGDVCPDNPNCKSSSGSYDYVCNGISNKYQYRKYSVHSSSGMHCPGELCGGDPTRSGACELTVSYENCSYTQTDGCCGCCCVILYRREWECK